MIEEVAKVELPFDETLTIKKHRIEPEKGRNSGKRISIVTGIHGDELEGQFVAYELSRRIHAEPDLLTGTVDIYPALNPLGVDSIMRGIPMFDLDMNRIFPGNKEGSMAEYVAAKTVEDIKGSDVCIDIHASNIYLSEIPQIRISEMTAKELVPLARLTNIDFIWVHQAATVLESTLAHSLNSVGTKTLVVEMGVGMRVTKVLGTQLVDGIFNLMRELGMWQGETVIPKKPIESQDGNVHFLNAAASGIFLQNVCHGKEVRSGELVGEIVDPLAGRILQKVFSPCNGLLFTLREYPVVYEGSLMGRILER